MKVKELIQYLSCLTEEQQELEIGFNEEDRGLNQICYINMYSYENRAFKVKTLIDVDLIDWDDFTTRKNLIVLE